MKNIECYLKRNSQKIRIVEITNLRLSTNAKIKLKSLRRNKIASKYSLKALTTYEEKSSNFTAKAGRHFLRQVVKFNITGNKIIH